MENNNHVNDLLSNHSEKNVLCTTLATSLKGKHYFKVKIIFKIKDFFRQTE